MYGVAEHSLGTVKSFYERSEACVRLDNKESETFRLFNLYIDGVMAKVNARVMGKRVKVEHNSHE